MGGAPLPLCDLTGGFLVRCSYCLWFVTGSSGSAAEPGQVGQLQHTGWAETRPPEAQSGYSQSHCVWTQAGPAGPLLCPGTLLPLCLGWQLVGEWLRCGPAWCHPKLQLSCLFWPLCLISCSSERCLSCQGRERWGRLSLALLIKNERLKCTVLILFPGRSPSAGFNLSPCGPVPVGAVSSGNFMEDEGARNGMVSRHLLRAHPQTGGAGTGTEALWGLPGLDPQGMGVQAAEPGAQDLALRQPWVIAWGEEQSCGVGEGSLLLRIKHKLQLSWERPPSIPLCWRERASFNS